MELTSVPLAGSGPLLVSRDAIGMGHGTGNAAILQL
eukprot:CAMPEP_0181484482 /NCGR_PEP_ID=MMETSP1110-20121109/46015_1 /TAXON_ID=174948 /ORGANISM="Symbiodinium sp., Strain CCMP421" /LENGTH=35 /DNA_ID= /DNA_START= /DNA_END= /DNA_ORIENTATION=